MNIRILTLTSLFCCSAGLAMSKSQIPQAKTPAAAVISRLMKAAGLEEIDTDETKKILTITAQIVHKNECSIHDLIQDQDFKLLATRAANRSSTIDAELITAMASNNTARVRDLLDLIKDSISTVEIAQKFLKEEIVANKEIVDPKNK